MKCPACKRTISWRDSGEECRCGARIWIPQPGPQTEVLRTNVDLLLIGGGVFGGKSTIVQFKLSQYATKRNFSGIVFRREATMFKGSGSLWEKARAFFPALGGKPRESPLFDWRFPSGAIIQFAGMEKAHDYTKHEGNEYAGIVFDEAQQFTGRQILRLLERNRAPLGYDGRCWMLLTCNPPAPDDDGYEFLHSLVGWYLDDEGYPRRDRVGKTRYFTCDEEAIYWVDADWRDEDGNGPTSFSFVPMMMDDNPIGESKNPRYRAKLRAQTKADQARKRLGCWINTDGGGLFAQGVIRWIDAESVPSTLVHRVRYWDQAATPEEQARTGGSATASVMGGLCLCPECDGWRFHRSAGGVLGEQCSFCNPNGIVARADVFEPRELIVWCDVTNARLGPAEVERYTRACAERDGVDVPIYIEEETGASGKANTRNYTQRILPEYTVVGDRPTGRKAVRANPLVAASESGLLFIVRGPNDAAISTAFAKYRANGRGPYADIVDAGSGMAAAWQKHDWPIGFAWSM